MNIRVIRRPLRHAACAKGGELITRYVYLYKFRHTHQLQSAKQTYCLCCGGEPPLPAWATKPAPDVDAAPVPR